MLQSLKAPRLEPVLHNTRSCHNEKPVHCNWRKVHTQQQRPSTAINKQIIFKKGFQIGKEEAKLLLLADDMIPYTDNHKDTTEKLLLINESVKLQDTKKNLCHFYTLTIIRKRNQEYNAA